MPSYRVQRERLLTHRARYAIDRVQREQLLTHQACYAIERAVTYLSSVLCHRACHRSCAESAVTHTLKRALSRRVAAGYQREPGICRSTTSP
eukprot:3493929-Rhodomonas_salina.1